MRMNDLLREAAMSVVETAREAGLSHSTVSKMVNGKLVSELSARKVLRVLSQRIGRTIQLSDVEELQLLDKIDK